jgi:hypothetical protein
MAQFVALRALSRTVKVRVKNSAGTTVTLSNTADTIVDLDDPVVRRALGHHSAIGQYIVTAANDFDGAVPLPTNT